MKAHGGADISASWFDIVVIIEGRTEYKRFDNTMAGIRDCFRWVESSLKVSVLVLAIEPTGRYGELLADSFVRRGHMVLQVQPFKFSRYAESLDMRGKSDFKDAHALALYSLERSDRLRSWQPKTTHEHELRDVQLLLRSLGKRKVAIKNQLQCGLQSGFVKEQLQRELENCEQRFDEALDYAKEVVDGSPTFSEDFRLLKTIPGIAEKSALLMLSLINFRAFRSSRSLAAFLGVTKRKDQSGTFNGKEGISKRGNKYIRRELFMPARSAREHNPAIHAFSQRMKEKGKHDWTIQMAVIRRLVTISWALVVNQVEFDRSYLNQHS